MEFIIVTGMSGAGKSNTVNSLEDIGFFCMDNLPPMLLPKFAELYLQSAEKPPRAAIVADARGGALFSSIFEALDELKKLGISYKILFIDASNEVIVRRYKETRRRHPLADEVGNSVEKCVETEREIMFPVRSMADYIVDTSYLSPQQLKERIAALFLGDSSKSMRIHCMSFGFKYGTTNEADLTFDVRCLPNPFYISELKGKIGLDKEVIDFVMGKEQTKGLLKRLYDLLDFTVPLYVAEGKSQLIIGIGCTGGKHRSVAIAEDIARHFSVDGALPVSVNHRDINKK